MRKRALGQSGIKASVVGLGTWGIGGWMWGGSEEAESVASIQAAIDAGIDLIDTAPIYGFGVSEEIVGKAIAGRREKVILATKCGLICGSEKGEHKFNSTAKGLDPNGHIPIMQYLGPESIRREVEGSLARLGTDYIDLHQTHWQDPKTPIEDTMNTLLNLKKEGKIRAIGVSNANNQHMEEYIKVGQLDADQEKYSMLDRGMKAEQLPYCLERNIAFLAYSPLSKGLLTGQITMDIEFPEGDMRRRDPRFTVENRKRITEMLEKFKAIAEHHGITLAQLVIAWTFHQSGLTHVLCGARDPRHAQENAAAADVALNDDELQIMNEVLDEYFPMTV